MKKKTQLIWDRSTLTLPCLRITETATQLPERTEAKEQAKTPTKQQPDVTAKLIHTPERGYMPGTNHSATEVVQLLSPQPHQGDLFLGGDGISCRGR